MKIIGFDTQKKYLEALRKGGALTHAHLLYGPDMIGKKSFIKELCANINGHSSSDLDPDLMIIENGGHDESSEISIKEVRDLKSFFSLKPLYGGYKVAIIDEAERLNIESSNALLKILEEPPKFGIIFLITSKPQFLLATIRSRCESVKCSELSARDIGAYLDDNKIKVADRELLLELANGRLGWALKAAKDNGLSIMKKTIEDFKHVARRGIAEKIQYAKELSEEANYKETVANLLSWLYAEHRKGKSALEALKGLLHLQNLLTKSEFNHRLAIENFLISI